MPSWRPAPFQQELFQRVSSGFVRFHECVYARLKLRDWVCPTTCRHEGLHLVQHRLLFVNLCGCAVVSMSTARTDRDNENENLHSSVCTHTRTHTHITHRPQNLRLTPPRCLSMFLLRYTFILVRLPIRPLTIYPTIFSVFTLAAYHFRWLGADRAPTHLANGCHCTVYNGSYTNISHE